MLSPLELENKRIITSKRKYDRYEMDEYLDMLFENYKALYNEYEEQKKQIKTLTDGIQYYRSIESTMQKALVLAEKTSKETKDAALLKAESIEKDAQGRAAQILSEAENEYNRIREKCLTLVQQFNAYKAQLQVAAKEQLRLVTSATFEVNTPDIDGQAASMAGESTMPGAEPVSPAAVYPTEPESTPTAGPSMEAYYQEPSAGPAPTETPTTGSSVYSFKGDTQPLPNLGPQSDYMSSDEVIPQIPVPDPVPAAPAGEPAPEAAAQAQAAPSSGEEFDFSDQFEMYADAQDAGNAPSASAAEPPMADKTMILPDVGAENRSAKRATKQPMTQAEAMSILTAETINLGDSIRAARDQEEPLQMQIPEPQPQPQTLKLEPAREIPNANGLDSILQNITIGKKKKQNGVTEEDPFEFLGSVDDF